jgi:hypothetical protein
MPDCQGFPHRVKLFRNRKIAGIEQACAQDDGHKRPTFEHRVEQGTLRSDLPKIANQPSQRPVQADLVRRSGRGSFGLQGLEHLEAYGGQTLVSLRRRFMMSASGCPWEDGCKKQSQNKRGENRDYDKIPATKACLSTRLDGHYAPELGIRIPMLHNSSPLKFLKS